MDQCRIYRSSTRIIAAFACLGGVIAPEPARAVEDLTPFIPGATIGIPAGLLPPPGLYGSLAFAGFSFNGKSDTGRNTGAKIESNPMALALLWVPGWSLFGASYGVGIIQPFRNQTLTTPRFTDQHFGPVNTILNLGTLSWRFENGLSASVGLNLYLNSGDYALGRPVNTGRNYTTFEPRFGISYVRDGWSLSGNVAFNVNTRNEATLYQSGSLIASDLTATRRFFGKLEVGLGSTIIYQFTDDIQAGIAVPAVNGGRGRGNRSRFVSVGPVVAYDFGAFTLSVYYQRSLLAENMAGGHQVWSRVNFPLYSTKPATQAELESAGRR